MSANEHSHGPGPELDEAGLLKHLQAQHGGIGNDDHEQNQGLHMAEHRVASRRAAAEYELVQIGGRTKGIMFARCVNCRALIEPSISERADHETYHLRNDKPAVSGW